MISGFRLGAALLAAVLVPRWAYGGLAQFDPARSYNTGQNPTNIDLADINGDGRPDYAVANHETSYLTVLIGTDGFGIRKSHTIPVGANPHPHVARLVDIDEDGRIDLLTDHRDGLDDLAVTDAGRNRLHVFVSRRPVR